MHSGKCEVIEDIPVPEDFLELIKCSVEDIWSDDDEFFDKKDTLKTRNLKFFFKHKSLPKRSTTYLLRDTEETEPIVSKNDNNTKCESSKKRCRSGGFSPSGTLEWHSNIVSTEKEDESEDSDFCSFAVVNCSSSEEWSGTELCGSVSDNTICKTVKGIPRKAVKLKKVEYDNVVVHHRDSKQKLITLSNEAAEVNDKESGDLSLSANCKTSIMASSKKLKKRKYDEVSMSEDSSDTGMASKKHYNAMMNEVKHAMSDSDSEKSVHVITENNKVSYLKDGLSRKDSGGKLQSGINLDKSDSENSFAPKQISVGIKKEDGVKCVVVSDASDDENRSSAVNSEHLKKKISSFVTKKLREEEDNMVFSEEVTNDDEAWIVQAPKSMNITAFFGQNFSLNDNFLLRDNGKVYEGFVSPVSNRRNANLVIPSMNTKSLQLRALPVAGSVIIEEKVNVLYATTLTLHKKKKTPLPQGLRQRHPLLGTAADKIVNSLSEESDIHSSVEKKKKKKRKREDSIASADKIVNSLSEESDIHSSVEKKKKKKRKREDSIASAADKIVNSLSEESDIHSSVEKKKKKKRKREDSIASGTDEIVSFSAFNKHRKPSDISDMGTDVVDNVTDELESDSFVKKKKKKKHCDISDTGIEMVDVTTELESDSFENKKKKKKKKKHSYISDTGTELVDNVTTKLTLDIFVKEKHKKKKKKKYRDSNDGEEEPSNMESDASMEVKEKKKRKHKAS